jgi:uncharacterized protein YfaS (alpha-2-macroglobulin family)
MKTGYDKLKKEDKDYLKNNHLGYEDIQYLYARSYFLDRVKLPSECSEMMAYYKDQATRYWKVNNNFMRAMIALSLHRSGDKTTPALILRSITETALHSEESGMFWRNDQRSWYWHQAPVETQAMLIEAFDEINHDVKSVDEMNLWLLKQKQTQDWKTTKATTEAIYALLLRGTTLLSDSRPVEIKLGAQKIVPQTTAEPGTGYIKTTWNAASIKPEMGKVEITNPNKGAAWGALYLQYFEQLDKITPAQTPLQLSKKLYLEKNTAEGPVIEEIKQNTTIKTGDRIVVRIELRADRDMEYLHLKDMRASAFEPLQTLSGYRYQDGLGYYQSIKDASANFFIYYLPKGTYIFEYKLFATQKGDFSNGITNIQCMYAPEFSAHSEGIRVKVE